MNPGNDWLDQARQLFDVVKSSLAERPTEPAHDSDCRRCPLCQAAAVIRGERPEVTAALADVLTATATALRRFADAAGSPLEPDVADTAGERKDDGPSPAVQRIEIA